MDGYVHKKVIKVNDKVVLERVKRLPDFKGRGEDLSSELPQLASSPDRVLKKNGSSALPDINQRQQVEDQQKKQRVVKIKTADIAMHLNMVEGEFRELRMRRLMLQNEKHNFEVISKQLYAEVAKLQTTNESLAKDVRDCKNQKQILDESLSKSNEKLNNLNHTINSARDKVKQKQQNLEELKAAEAKLDESLRSKSLQELQAKLLSYHHQKKAAENEIASIKPQLEILKKESADLENEVKEQASIRDELAEKLEISKAEVTSLETQVREQNKVEAELVENLAEKNKFLEEKKALDQEIEQSVFSLDKKVMLLASTKDSLESKMAMLEVESKALENHLADMESILKETRSNIQSYNLNITDKRKKKNELLKQKEAIEAEVNKLDNEVGLSYNSDIIFTC